MKQLRTLTLIALCLTIGGCVNGDPPETESVRIEAAVGRPELDVLLLGAYTFPSSQLLQPSVNETSADVTVTLSVPKPEGAVSASAGFRCIEVRLDRPLGGRALIDEATGLRFQVSESADPLLRDALLECAGTTGAARATGDGRGRDRSATLNVFDVA